MNRAKATKLTAELRGHCFASRFTVVDCINNGKSAVVFGAVDGAGTRYALKIFDEDLVERFGKTEQLQRIEREKALIGHSHENIVTIVDGGEDPDTGYLYVAMERVDAPNIAQALQAIPIEIVPVLVKQIADAARYLEGLGLAHRDIKPENIAYLGDTIKLLDLGVLRPFSETESEDGTGNEFVGTLQYSSPEFLFRREENSVDGWRAVTFYQIGAVMHDLIVRRPIFEAYATPFSRLVEAVKDVIPPISSTDYSPEMIALARACLIKDPNKRLQLVSWENFDDLVGEPKPSSTKTRVLKRAALRAAEQTIPPRASDVDLAKKIRADVESAIRVRTISLRNEIPFFPPVQESIVKGGRLKVFVHPSNELGIEHGLSIFFQIEVVDAASNAIRVLCVAVVGKATKVPDDQHIMECLLGVFDTELLARTVDEVVFWAIDVAHDKSAQTILSYGTV